MPSTIVTPWGHHLPDPELSRAAAERSLIIQAIREHGRGRPEQRRGTTWLRRRQVRIAVRTTR
ncbi:MAG TPA: hypothetical protein VFU98_11580 [Microlunatus sp.]|nr:hypothetical protein [Microlunatus sp.]